MRPLPVRLAIVCALLGLFSPTPAKAQIELTPLFGLHVDHPPRSEYAIVYQYTRNLPFGDTWEISQPSTLPTYGGRVELILHPRFRIQGEAVFSKNEHSRNYILNSEPAALVRPFVASSHGSGRSTDPRADHRGFRG
jgi:hypothetical protein